MAINTGIPLDFKPPAPINPLAQYGEVLGIQNAQQQQASNALKLQSEALNVQQAQRQADYQKAFTTAVQKHTTQNPDGSLSTDMAGIQGDVTNAGFGPEAMSMNKSILEAREAALKLQETQHAVATQRLNDVANTLAAIPRPDPAKPDPSMVVSFNAAFPAQVQTLLKKGTIDPGMAQQYMQIFQNGGGTGTPGWSPQLAQTLSGLDQSVMTAQQRAEQMNQVLTNAREGTTALTTQAKNTADTAKINAEMADKQKSDAAAMLSQVITDANSGPRYDVAKADLIEKGNKAAANLPDSKDLDFTSPDAARQTVLRSAMNAAEVATDERSKKLSDNSLLALRANGQQTGNSFIDKMTPAAANTALQRLKPPPTNVALSVGGAATADDFVRAGEQYARTGVMPPLGMNGGPARLAILHQANEFARNNGLSPSDLVTMQAAYSGDKSSLAAFQKQRDNIASFEKTAGKNLDQFLSLAGKIPDTGVPWINTPIRNLDQNAVGSENMAAVNAARAVATNEIAKVTAGGGISSVLSDAARQEVKNYNPANATFAQTKAIAKVLKQDMENRRTSMDETLGDIKSRLGGSANTSGGNGGQPAATKRFNPATGQIEPVTQ